MVYRLLIIIFIININISYANIIYDKNNITINDIELYEYTKIYNNTYGASLTRNEAIKKIVLMKKTLNFLEINNPQFIELLDKNIESQFNKNDLNNKIQFDFIRFLKVRNEFISEYFQNEFNFNDFKKLISYFPDLKIPLSKNNCLTIEKIFDLKLNDNFIENLYKNFKNSSKDFKVKINNEIYSACLDNSLYKKIEDLIIEFIEKETNNNFNKFIYQKIN